MRELRQALKGRQNYLDHSATGSLDIVRRSKIEMTSTHLSLHYHLVFSTKERRALIAKSWRERLHSYLGGILRSLGGVPESVGGTSDHVHLLAGLEATRCLAAVMRDVKSSSFGWVHRNIGSRLFSWQDGYGAFTVSSSQIETIKRYIQLQEEHHRNKTFQEEHLELLREGGIEYDKRYLW